MSEPKKRGKAASADLTPEQKAAKKAERDHVHRTRFLTLAPKRVNNVIKQLVNVSRCANKQGYSYTDDEAKKIVAAVGHAFNQMAESFASKSDGKPTFTL